MMHPEISNMVNEYKDGILLFEISNREIWAKASQDTVGQKRVFEANRDKYTWKEPRWRGRIVLCKDAATEKKVNKILSTESDDEVIDNKLRELNKNGTVVRRVCAEASFIQGSARTSDTRLSGETREGMARETEE